MLHMQPCNYDECVKVRTRIILNEFEEFNIWVWLGALEWWPHPQNKGPKKYKGLSFTTHTLQPQGDGLLKRRDPKGPRMMR